jgi:chemotaxis methyl-accepting protein methylase
VGWCSRNGASACCLLHEGLLQRMAALGLGSCHEYYLMVEWHPQGQEEWSCLLNLLTNPETSFFRQRPMFDALAQHMLPELAAAKARRG